MRVRAHPRVEAPRDFEAPNAQKFSHFEGSAAAPGQARTSSAGWRTARASTRRCGHSSTPAPPAAFSRFPTGRSRRRFAWGDSTHGGRPATSRPRRGRRAARPRSARSPRRSGGRRAGSRSAPRAAGGTPILSSSSSRTQRTCVA